MSGRGLPGVAVVGVGRMGARHCAAIRRSSALALVAVADPSPVARAAAPGDDLGRFADVRSLLDATVVDAAVVAVPTARHAEVAGELLWAGVPVLCEKPGGLRSIEVAELGALAERAGVPLEFGYWRRFVPALQRLREQVLDGALGEVAVLTAVQWDGEPPPAAFRDPATSGGIAVDMGVHEFDMLRWLTGQEIDRCIGLDSHVAWSAPVPGDPEAASLVLRLSGGACATVSLARRHPPGDLCRVEVLGGDGARALTYLEPAREEETMLDALRRQAEGLLAANGNGPAAAPADARAALAAAEAARAALGGGP